ncbi:MAG: hypothetical protein HQM10_09430 [Candidatus Riflebacteria bacterium]|nr:hypothetical protein [Candidatus Riflebacteria bacterium]
MRKTLVLCLLFCMGATFLPAKVIKFTPRQLKGKKIVTAPDPTTAPFSQGILPPFTTSAQSSFSLNTTACLVHGLAASYAKMAIEAKFVNSAYYREGPEGSYSRDADKRGGGALAVYTRAVGTRHNEWRVMGYGVGSSDSKVQLILSPAFLLERYGEWRASGIDCMGVVPGASLRTTKKEEDCWDMWGKQTEASRNKTFTDTVTASRLIENNEQLIWEKVDLEGTLKAIVCMTPASFNELMTTTGATKTTATRGTIQMGTQQIEVTIADKSASLLKTLRDIGVANAQSQVR